MYPHHPELLLLAALLVAGGGMQHQQPSPVCWLDLTAELRANTSGAGGRELHVTFSLEEEDICTNTHLLDEQFDMLSLRPILQLSTCPTRGEGPATSLPGHTLLTTLELMESGNTSGSHWMLALPPYLDTDCVELTVRQSSVGAAGTVIPELRFRFRSLPQDRVLSEDLFSLCVETGENYAEAFASWVVLEETSSCEGDKVIFQPGQVHFVTDDELFITGNGLVYSPNQGAIFYQLLLPAAITEINQFVFSEDFKTYAAVITVNSTSTELWLGFSGNPGLVRLSPSPLLSQFQSSPLAETVWDDARISLTSHNRLLLTHENMDYRIPVPALASFYFHSLANSSDPCPSALLGTHPLDLFTSGFTPLTPCPNRQCPFVAASLEARVCSEVTRSFLHFPEGNQLMPQPETFPEQNCLMVASSLPSDIYLGRLGTYSVTVTLELLGIGEVGSDVQYSVWSSDTTNLNITVSEDFREDGAALRHQVHLAELGLFAGQYLSGNDASVAVIDFQIPGVALQCMDPLSRFTRLPGSYRTRLHIGCPPGLSLVFDATATMAPGQYCTPRDNISCYYFGNVFFPKFQVLDNVTGRLTNYTGQYTLRLVAGGSEVDAMAPFSADTEKSIWYPLNTVAGVHRNGSGTRWVCASYSPCGELLPRDGQLPQYYLLVEATNNGVMENESYCNFSVQFTIRLHGIPMGAITSSIILLVWLFVLSVLVLVMFIFWLVRDRLASMMEPVGAWVSMLWRQEGRREWLVEEVRRRTIHSIALPSVQLQSEDEISVEQESFMTNHGHHYELHSI